MWMTEQLILIAWAFKYTIPGSRCVGESRALDTAVSFSIFKMYPLKSNTKQETLETYDRMTVHSDRCLVNKIKRCTEVQFCWYYDSTRRMELHSRSILLLVANGHHNFIKCTKADVRLRTSDDG